MCIYYSFPSNAWLGEAKHPFLSLSLSSFIVQMFFFFHSFPLPFDQALGNFFSFPWLLAILTLLLMQFGCIHWHRVPTTLRMKAIRCKAYLMRSTATVACDISTLASMWLYGCCFGLTVCVCGLFFSPPMRAIIDKCSVLYLSVIVGSFA